MTVLTSVILLIYLFIYLSSFLHLLNCLNLNPHFFFLSSFYFVLCPVGPGMLCLAAAWGQCATLDVLKMLALEKDS